MFEWANTTPFGFPMKKKIMNGTLLKNEIKKYFFRLYTGGSTSINDQSSSINIYWNQ